jgi:hypothetical protein
MMGEVCSSKKLIIDFIDALGKCICGSLFYHSLRSYTYYEDMRHAYSELMAYTGLVERGVGEPIIITYDYGVFWIETQDLGFSF